MVNVIKCMTSVFYRDKYFSIDRQKVLRFGTVCTALASPVSRNPPSKDYSVIEGHCAARSGVAWLRGVRGPANSKTLLV